MFLRATAFIISNSHELVNGEIDRSFKNMISQLCLLLCLFSVVNGVSHPRISADQFCYNDADGCGPSYWEGVCSSGIEQSPVDIELKYFDKLFPKIRKTTFFLSDNYRQEINNLYARNTGHSFQVQLANTTTSNLMLKGADLKASYTFAQLHFHWGDSSSAGSEHTIHGKSYPMELHLVHYKSIYSSLTEAMDSANDREAIAVIGILFEISKIPNKQISGVINAVSASTVDPSPLQNFQFPLRVSSFFPWKLDFVRYLGSLTTPTCNENVVWTVFRYPIPISESQMAAFRRLRGTGGESINNHRPTRPLNGRKLRYYKAKGLGSIIPSIDRIWSVAGGVQTFFSHFKFALVNTLIAPSTILNALTRLMFRLLWFIIPIAVFNK